MKAPHEDDPNPMGAFGTGMGHGYREVDDRRHRDNVSQVDSMIAGTAADAAYASSTASPPGVPLS